MTAHRGKNVIIVDLDGTVQDSTKRSHHIHNKDWDAFHAESEFAEPHMDVIEMLKMIDSGSIDGVCFIAVTGRNEKFREITLNWLRQHKVPIDTLWMRPDDDYRSDTVLKLELINEALAHHEMTLGQILFAIDDRDRVVDAYREAGINTYQVRNGTY